MKAEDLMIGDWVKFNNSDLAHQIKAIAGKSVKVDKVYWYSASKLSPIPITSEILEKNGFTYKEGEIGLCGVTTVPHYIRNDVPFALFCDGEPFAIWIFQNPTNIKYVHELQHALRLCGIEKEIVL